MADPRFTTFALLALCSCGRAPARPLTTADQPEWALLYYGIGDNSLSTDIVDDVREMTRHGSTRTVTLAAQIDVDQHKSFEDDSRFLIPAREPLPWLPAQAGLDHPVETFAELDSGSAETLRDFLTWAVRTIPARHYALVLSGHGYGYSARVRRPPVDSPDSRYFSFDQAAGPGAEDPEKSVLTTRELTEVLNSFQRDGKPLFEVVVADSCVSQTLENAYALRNATSVYVASQEAERASGHDYGRTLQTLHEVAREWDLSTRTAQPFTAARFGRAMVQGYISQNHKNSQASAIRVDKLEPVVQAVHALAREARAHADLVETWMRKDATYFGGSLAPRLWVDLVWMSQQLQFAGAVQSETDTRLKASVKEATILTMARGPGSVGTTHGLSLTFPGFERVLDPQRERGSVQWEIEVELGILESEVTAGPVADLLNFLHCRGPLGCDFDGETFRYPE